MATQNLVTTDRATRESEFPIAVLSSNESLSTQLTVWSSGIVIAMRTEGSMFRIVLGPCINVCLYVQDSVSGNVL